MITLNHTDWYPSYKFKSERVDFARKSEESRGKTKLFSGEFKMNLHHLHNNSQTTAFAGVVQVQLLTPVVSLLLVRLSFGLLLSKGDPA